MKRLNKIEHDYFDIIDTEYKAYILGFITADGCVCPARNGRQKSLRVSIQLEDGYILNKLIKDVCNRTPVTKYSPAQIRSNELPQANISISSDHLCDKLEELGCVIRKTNLGITMPTLPSGLVHHYIRGFFDGNGCITVSELKNRYTRVAKYPLKHVWTPKLRKRAYFISTDKTFLEDLLNQMNLPFAQKLQWSGKQTLNLYTWKIGIESLPDVKLLEDYLYRDATVYLTRKRDKFLMTIKSEAGDTSPERVETTCAVQTA